MIHEYGTGISIVGIDYYAFPRTGSHFFRACMSGLFDLISSVPARVRTNAEVTSRRDEISGCALYALDLRESGSPFQPVCLNPIRNGTHGTPTPGDNPTVILIRHPLATLYSAWRTRRRLGWAVDSPEQMKAHLDDYERFYDAALSLMRDGRQPVLILHYEQLIESAEPLERLVRFVGIRPKLTPQFVHRLTCFKDFVKPGDRQFYLAGDNEAWVRDAEFVRQLSGAEPVRDYNRFGYRLEVLGMAR